MNDTIEKKKPSFGYALFTMGIILGGITILGGALGYNIRILFLLSWMLAFPLCMRIGYSYAELQKGMFSFMARCLVPVSFFISVGALIGIWNASGTIANATYWGMKLINPKIYQVTAFIICTIFAVITGTSWGSVGTVGIALFGVGIGMDMDPIAAAAPIICGAFAGDGLSPLSDTPNSISAAVQIDLFEFFKYQLRMTIPCIIISCIIFFIAGLMNQGGTANLDEIVTITGAIQANFKLGIITFAPVIIVIALLCMKVPTIPSILSGALSGMLVAVFYQGYSFKEALNYMYSGFVMNSGDAFIDKLFSRGGVASMSGNTFMLITAFGVFGILHTAGVLDSLVEPLAKRIHSRTQAGACAILLSVIAHLSSSTTFAAVFTGNFLGDVYDELKISRFELANALTVGCLMLGLWVPWGANIVAVCASLDVQPMTVVPHLYTVYVYVVVFFVLTLLNKKTGKEI